MGMTKASVFPLPVTCGGGEGAGWFSLAPHSGGEMGGRAAPTPGTHGFRGDVFVAQEQRDGCGLRREGKALVRGSCDCTDEPEPRGPPRSGP